MVVSNLERVDLALLLLLLQFSDANAHEGAGQMHGEKILILNPIRERFLVEKYGAKVLAKLFDSRTSYIASVTIVQRAG